MTYIPADCPCPYVNNFSNPSVSVNGFATGIADMADNARALRENGASVANFMSDSYALTVAKTGSGKVKSDLAGLDCGPVCTQKYPKPEIRTVTLTPTADLGWSFKEWTGACQGSGACVLTVDQDKQVSARFEPNADFLSVQLFDVKKNRDIAALEGTSTFRLDTLPAQFTFQAKVLSAAGSIKFDLIGPQLQTRIDSDAPYSLFGDQGGANLPWAPAPMAGRYNLNVTAYGGSNGTGTVLAAKKLVFEFKPAVPVTSIGGLAGTLSGFRLMAGGFEMRLEHDVNLEVTLRSLQGKAFILRKGEFQAGRNAVSWPAGGIAGGVYLLRVAGEGNPLLRTMVRVP